MNVTICLPPDLAGYLRQFPQYQWEKCILLTLALGVKCVQQSHPGEASLEDLIGCLEEKQREAKKASLRIPHQSPRAREKREKAAVPVLRKHNQPRSYPEVSTVRRSKSARVESTAVTEPRTNPVYVKKLTTATDSLLAITSRFLSDPLLTALSTSPH